jgi:sigma-B regulation protein RsbU (phosphoserine phosphatase)
VRTIRREIDEGIARRKADSSARREFEDAQRIQRALLPSSFPRLRNAAIAAAWTPASSFGGDCYDVIALDDGRIGVSIADVAGKGLPAALLMSNLQASVRAFAGESLAPSIVAARTNAALCRNGALERFVTFFYGVVDSHRNTLTYCNAGHNPPILVRQDGSLERLSTGGVVLGIFDAPAYENGRVQLHDGDRLVLFTDGITEANSVEVDQQEFGDERLIDLITAHRAEPPQPLVETVMAGITSFAGPSLADDATVVCLAYGRSTGDCAAAQQGRPTSEQSRA